MLPAGIFSFLGFSAQRSFLEQFDTNNWLFLPSCLALPRLPLDYFTKCIDFNLNHRDSTSDIVFLASILVPNIIWTPKTPISVHKGPGKEAAVLKLLLADANRADSSD